MGAEMSPPVPVPSVPLWPPFLMKTATAICGSSAGAKPVNQVCGAASSPVVPAGAVGDHAGHHLGQLARDVAGDRLAHLLRVGLVDDGEVGGLDRVDQVGL